MRDWFSPTQDAPQALLPARTKLGLATPGVLIALWALAIAALVYAAFIIEPRRGIDFTSDEGLFLYHAWSAASGFGGDPLMAQAPHYLFNAALITMGFDKVWHLILAYHLLNFTAVGVFLTSIDDRGPRAPQVPAAIALCQLINLNTILNHYTTSILLGLLGLGLLIWGARTPSQRGFLLKSLAIPILAVAAVANFAIGVAISLTVGLFFLLDRPRKGSALVVFYVCLLAALIFCYWLWIGSDALLSRPVARDSSFAALFGRARRIASFFAEIGILYALSLIIVCIFKRKKADGNVLALSLSAGLIFFSIALVAYLLQTPIDTRLASNFFWVTSGEQRSILMSLPFVGLSLLTVSVLAGLTREIEARGRRLPAQTTGGWTARFMHASPAPQQMFGRLILASFSLLAMFVLGSVGSNTHILLGGIWTAGCAIGLTTMWLDWLDGPPAKRATIFACLWIPVILIYGSTFNHSSGQKILSPESIPFVSGPFTNLRATNQHHRFLEEITSAYNDFGCRHGVLITLEYTPLIPYFLRHRVPDRMGAIRPAFYFPGERIQNILSNAKHWCVINATGIETAGYAKALNREPRAKVIDWIKRNSRISRHITAPDALFVGDITVYSSN